MLSDPLVLALLGTGFSFLGTAAGAAMVYLLKKDVNVSLNRAFMGFASGVMIAAAVWSLMLPALSMAQEQGMVPWAPAAAGFLFGGVFLFVLDKLMPHLHAGSDRPEGLSSSFKRTTMLVLAVTLHNIPEGMAVGLSFALAAREGSSVTLAGAAALALGMALQNFPEGAAISLPLRKEGFSRTKAFAWGAMSGIVEPAAGVLGVVLALTIVHVMPYMLSFAAGAMIYVVIDELVPSAYNEHSNAGTLAAMVGFVLMMILDLALG
jgi:ZIP family zinc transporter